VELAEEITRTLIKREPQNVMHVVALAEVMGKREDPLAAGARRFAGASFDTCFLILAGIMIGGLLLQLAAAY